MRISLPPIASRWFSVYWGLITFATSICTIGILQFGPYFSKYLTPYGIPILLLLYCFASNGIPLILLNPHLKRKQKIVWITSESISYSVFIMGIWWIALCRAFADDVPRTEVSIGSLYGFGAYHILAIAMVVWIIAAAFQSYTIKFKRPKRWLIYAVSTRVIAYLLTCLFLVAIPSDSNSNILLSSITVIFLYFVSTPSLTGLGLYLSGMGVRERPTIP
jgi:hypothetical protein